MEYLAGILGVIVIWAHYMVISHVVESHREGDKIVQWLNRHKRIEDLAEEEKSALADRIRRSSVPYHEYARWEEEQRKKKS